MKFTELHDTARIPEGMRSWSARSHGYQFVIVHEPGDRLETPEERAEWTGYTATYKRRAEIYGPAIRIPGIWPTFEEAEQACKDFLHRMTH